MIYVDQLEYKKPKGRKYYCHMVADSLDELHEFAALIGRKRCWFHNHRSYPHYDLDEAFKSAALSSGAIEIKTQDIIMAKKMNKTIQEYLSSVEID